mmetsp:Transcript_17411/g.41847  ORF Transcript_17411/g.41847 Transcript_17411/m.41847 type:complete len:115 (-) Transcript_17411:279-623(-)
MAVCISQEINAELQADVLMQSDQGGRSVPLGDMADRKTCIGSGTSPSGECYEVVCDGTGRAPTASEGRLIGGIDKVCDDSGVARRGGVSVDAGRGGDAAMGALLCAAAIGQHFG